jgi:hypothetical protein
VARRGIGGKIEKIEGKTGRKQRPTRTQEKQKERGSSDRCGVYGIL